MTAYYNEFDPYAAQWLRNLIAAGHIAPGVVDERSIADVEPDELSGFTQCHFFAGLGGWARALRLTDWPDDRPVWTGSCPCPPFSAAGKGSSCPSCGGKSCLSHPLITAGWICLDCGDEWRGDDRHLLPEFIRLWGECRPPRVFGEQVASSDGVLWLYTVRATVEECGYALGGSDLPAAGVGAPHIRQRLWFGARSLADAEGEHRARQVDQPGSQPGIGREGMPAGGRLHPRRLGHDDNKGLEGQRGGYQAQIGHGEGTVRSVAEAGEPCRLADADRDEQRERRNDRGSSIEGLRPDADGCIYGGGLADPDGSAGRQRGAIDGRRHPRRYAIEGPGPRCGGLSDSERPGPTNGFWRNPDWLFCRDERWRPVEPGTFPLAHGIPARVGRLRAYGNAIVPQVAAQFIRSFEGAVTDVADDGGAS